MEDDSYWIVLQGLNEVNYLVLDPHLSNFLQLNLSRTFIVTLQYISSPSGRPLCSCRDTAVLPAIATMVSYSYSTRANAFPEALPEHARLNSSRHPKGTVGEANHR